MNMTVQIHNKTTNLTTNDIVIGGGICSPVVHLYDMLRNQMTLTTLVSVAEMHTNYSNN